MSTLKEKHKTLYDMLKLSEDDDFEPSDDISSSVISSSVPSDIRSLISQEVSSQMSHFNKEKSDTDIKKDSLDVESVKSESKSSDSDFKLSHKSSNSSLPTHKQPPKPTLPKKSKSNSQSRKMPVKTHFKTLYKELKPINVVIRSKEDLLSFDDKEVVQLLRNYDSDLCIISSVLQNRNVSSDLNMKRCLRFVEELKNNNYLYLPVYLTNKNSNQILDIIFIVYTFPIKQTYEKRTFKNLFNLINDISSRFMIPNCIYKEDDIFTLKCVNKVYCLHLKEYKDVILYLSKVNQNQIDENSELFVNQKCSSNQEYYLRHKVNNELCVQ